VTSFQCTSGSRGRGRTSFIIPKRGSLQQQQQHHRQHRQHHYMTAGLFPSTTITLSSSPADVTADTIFPSASATIPPTIIIPTDHLEESSSLSLIIQTILHSPIFWSCTVMITIVTLLLIWDEFLEYAKEETPKSLQPVISSMLAEMGSLGFIGIIISILLNRMTLGETVGNISYEYLGGERDLLFETFEYLHEAFFQVGILFFISATNMIIKVTQNLNQIYIVLQQECDDSSDSNNNDNNNNDDDNCIIPQELSITGLLGKYFPVYTLPLELVESSSSSSSNDTSSTASTTADDLIELEDKQTLWVYENEPSLFWKRELFMSSKERGAEVLVIRERLISELGLEREFRISSYLESIIANENIKIVGLSPLAWLPAIPILALGNSIDLAHDVVNAESINAAAASGYFYSTPWVLYPFLILEGICLFWGVFNFWKMAEIKRMLLPSLVQEYIDGPIKIIPPGIENQYIRSKFDSSRPSFIIKPLERLFRKELPKTINMELFGEIGANGPDVYLNSIKFQTWFSVINLYFFSSQILFRDLYAICNPSQSVNVGNPEYIIPEVITFGLLLVLNAVQIYVAPTTFLNFCLVTCVEDLKQDLLDKTNLIKD
jgi:hypothetical protein